MTKSLVLLLALLLWSDLAAAHTSAKSYLRIDIDESSIQGQLRVALSDLDRIGNFDSNRDGRVTRAEVSAQAASVGSFALNYIELQEQGRNCPLTRREARVDGPDLLVEFTARCSTPPKIFRLRYDLFMDTDAGHQGHVNVQRAGQSTSFVLTSKKRTRAIDAGATSRASTLREYVPEGVIHIWLGFDHILFLLTLLFPVVLVRRGREWQPAEHFGSVAKDALRVVTAFTLAHSVTLCLAALGLVRFPDKWIECIIAASVVLAAVNNVRTLFPERKWLVAGGFGLVHGFGFASVLSDLGLPKGQLLLALFGFNAGVEVGQVVIVIGFLPLAFLLRRHQLYVPVLLRAGSAAVAGVGLLWFFERILDFSTLESASRLEPSRTLGISLAILGGVVAVSAAGAFAYRKVSKSKARVRFIRRLSWAGAGGAIALIAGLVVVKWAEHAWNAARASRIEQLAVRWTNQHGDAVFSDVDFQRQLIGSLDEALERVAEDGGRRLVEALFATGDTRPIEMVLLQRTHHYARVSPSRAAVSEARRAIVTSLRSTDEAQEAYANSLKHEPRTLATLYELGLILGRAGRLDEAKRTVENLLSVAKARGDSLYAARALEAVGEISLQRNELDLAQTSLIVARDSYEELDELAAQARVVRALAEVQIQRASWTEALPHLMACRDLYAKLGAEDRLALTLSRIGDLYVAGGDAVSAARLYEEALRLHGKLEDAQGQAAQYRNLAIAARLMRDDSKAARMYRRALELHEDLGLPSEISKDNALLAKVYVRNREYAEAIPMLERVRDVSTSTGDRIMAAKASADLGNVYQKQDKLDEAEEAYRQALVGKASEGEQLANVYANLGNVHKSRGEFEKARDMYEKSLVLFNENGALRKARRVESYLALLDGAALTRAATNDTLAPGRGGGR